MNQQGLIEIAPLGNLNAPEKDLMVPREIQFFYKFFDGDGAVLVRYRADYILTEQSMRSSELRERSGAGLIRIVRTLLT